MGICRIKGVKTLGFGLQCGVVEVHPYDAEWIGFYKEEEMLLLDSIGQYVADIQHIGSTAIPGQAAKPIIDIMVGTRDLEWLSECVEKLEKLGYEYKGENGISGRFFFVKGDAQISSYHLHMVEWQSQFWKSHLFFRDYLSKHKDAVIEYANLKQDLALKFPTDRDAYTEGKAHFISEIIKKAEELLFK